MIKRTPIHKNKSQIGMLVNQIVHDPCKCVLLKAKADFDFL